MISEFIAEFGSTMALGVWQTLVMVSVATALGYLVGLPLGVLLYSSMPGGLHPNKVINTLVGWVVNIGRSIPFIILLVAIIPLTRLMVGTASGTLGAIPPLTLATIPFVARMVEQSIQEVDSGMIEAAQSVGASVTQILWRVIVPEAMPGIIRGLSITLITLFGYSAMAGAVGAGGLGDIAIRYGYYRYEDTVMIVTIVILVILVQIAQSLGDYAARKVDKRNV